MKRLMDPPGVPPDMFNDFPHGRPPFNDQDLEMNSDSNMSPSGADPSDALLDSGHHLPSVPSSSLPELSVPSSS